MSGRFDQKDYIRRYSRARNIAIRRLIEQHQDEYDRLFADARRVGPGKSADPQ